MKQSDDKSLLELFEVLEESPETTQRHLADRLGIALGMTNTLLRRAAKQGWLRIRKRDKGKQSYHLTDKGIGEKGRLMMDQIQNTLRFYNEARQLARVCFEDLKQQGISSIAIAGTSNVSEILYLAAKEVGLEVVAFVDAGRRRSKWLDVDRIHPDDLKNCAAEILVLDTLKQDELAFWQEIDFPIQSLIA